MPGAKTWTKKQKFAKKSTTGMLLFQKEHFFQKEMLLFSKRNLMFFLHKETLLFSKRNIVALKKKRCCFQKRNAVVFKTQRCCIQEEML